MQYKHIDNVDVSAKFSDNKRIGRYRLEVVHKKRLKKAKTVCVVMQNPSKADEGVADKSVQAIEKVVFEKKYKELDNIGRLIIVNQFAAYQTNDFKGDDNLKDDKNDKEIELAIKEADIILIAWGCSNKYKARKEYIEGLIRKEQNKKKKKVYRTSIHPSRVKYEGFIIPFELKKD